MDVVRAVLGVVVLDRGAAARGSRSSGRGRAPRARPRRTSARRGRRSAIRSHSAAATSARDPLEVVPDQAARSPPAGSAPARRDGCRPGSTGRRPARRVPLRMSAGATGVDDRDGALAGRQRRRAGPAPAPPRRSAPGHPPAARSGPTAGLAPRNDGALPIDPAAGERDVDRDVMAADAPRPRSIRRRARRRPRTSTAPDRVGASSRAGRRPLERTEDRFEGDDRLRPRRRVRALSARRQIAVAAVRWSRAMSRSARPARGPGRVRPRRTVPGRRTGTRRRPLRRRPARRARPAPRP